MSRITLARRRGVLAGNRLLSEMVCVLIVVTGAMCWETSAQAPDAPEAGTEQSPEPIEGDQEARPVIESIEAQIEELGPQIESAVAAANEETAQRLGVTLAALTDRADRLRSLRGVLQQQIGALQRLAELSSTQVDLDQEVATFHERGLEEPPPYTLTFADRLYDEALSEQRNLESIQSALDTITAELAAARERLRDAERARRTALESLDANTDPALVQRLTWEANQAVLDERFHTESVTARELRRNANEAERSIGEKRLALAGEKSAAVQAQVRFARSELDARLDEIATQRDAVERGLSKLRDSHQMNEALRREARDELQNAQGDAAISARTAVLALRTANLETAARSVELAEKKLSLYDQAKLIWERRFAVRQNPDHSELTDWKTETTRVVQEWGRDRQIQESRLIDLRANILDLEKQLSEWDAQRDGKEVIEARVQALRDRETSLNEYLATLLPLERLATRLLEDIDAENEHVTIQERWHRVQRFLGSIWEFELFVFEDDSITVRKIVIALLILVIGIFAAGYITRMFRTRLLARTSLNENAAAAVEKLLYYVALVLIGLYALNFVNIPLTLFALFGGAVAIAFGFGAQHIINNFISGFILMLERPIRIGDLVEINGVYGHIRHIGARSTRLHTAENIDLLIPNSQLLENVVINWTLTDEKLRTSVSVGVSYGSPTELVTELLMKSATGSKRILDSPKPIILFTGFGDNSLAFELHFWLKMRRIMDKRQAESEVYYNIDRLFRENNIVISFPQRDVHLDAVKAIDVRVIQDQDG